MTHKIAVLPGDGVGTEIVAEAEKLLGALAERCGLGVELERGGIGGAAVDATGSPLPEATLALSRDADAVLLGAVGGPKWDNESRERRPETGLLGIRRELALFANLRPAILYPELAGASSLRPELVAGLDIMIVRELTGGIYFGEPRGIVKEGNERVGINTQRYTESEIERVARSAFELARKRSGKVCSMEKANVMESGILWREIVQKVHDEAYPDVELSHMYADAGAMQLCRWPKQFDVMLCGNMFGDIISDEAAMLTGSLGMLPSASLAEGSFGMYEPSGGSAPDIAGKGIANPIAQILSAAMMLRYSFDMKDAADAVEKAVEDVLDKGYRTGDIHQGTDSETKVNTVQMGDAILKALNA